jgi:hypothetical protein
MNLSVVTALLLLLVGSAFYFGWYFQWELENTAGMAYFGRSSAHRQQLKRRMRRYSAPVIPFVRVLAAMHRRTASMPVFEYDGVCGPPTVSNPQVFASAARYRPVPQDVFVASQMRCGTTWMLQVVYETLSRGRGNLDDGGHRQLHAVCPWIEALNGVALENAPRIGASASRIIKTHLPTRLCPYDDSAKYIYITRHPVDCFASVQKYFSTLLGPLAPTTAQLADWYCSDRMYWSAWPEHVMGWWNWSQSRDNVLFIHYEEMRTDFGRILDRISTFLDVPLNQDEKALIAEKCSFEYMKLHEDQFEMSPPTMFSVAPAAHFLSGGSLARELSPDVRSRVLEYCRTELRAGTYPAVRFYPDLQPGLALS